MTTKITLFEWIEESPENILDIDWPRVQKKIGIDQLDWLSKQQEQDCQLLLEYNTLGIKTLVVEFYNDQILSNYGMMFAN